MAGDTTFAGFHDMKTPTMANFKLLPLWSQPACQIPENSTVSSLKPLWADSHTMPALPVLPVRNYHLRIQFWWSHICINTILLLYLFLMARKYFSQCHWYVKCNSITSWLRYGYKFCHMKEEKFLWLCPFKHFSSNSFWHLAWWKGTAHKQRLGNMLIF